MWCIYMGIIYKKTCIINCVLLRQVDASHSALPWHREDESMSGQSSEGNARCRDIYIHIWIFIAVNMEVQWLLFFISVGWGNRFYFDSDSAWISSLVRFTRALTSLALTRPITQQQSGKSADLWIDSRTCLPLLDPCLVPSVQYIYISPIRRWATSAASHVAILLVVLPITAGPVAPKPAIIRLKEASGQKQSDAATSSAKAASGWTGDGWISSSKPELLYFTFR